MKVLAINGGKKIRSKLFPKYNNIDNKEKKAVKRVLKSGVLSKFLGGWCDDFFGGYEVKKFEKEWAEYYKTKYCVSVNSNSSGLHVALGACGVGYGDEVIVTPYSICVSATAPLIWNAIPVFADIDSNNYCISPKEFKKKITSKTKAIIIVHLFGCPADMDEIVKIAKDNNIYVIEDCAQAPGSLYKDKNVGSIGDIGVFSLNYHKHIHTGEGGMCITENDDLAVRMQLIRNHAEAVVEKANIKNLNNMIGYNMRLTELQAAIGRSQLNKLEKEIKIRQNIAERYNESLSRYDFIEFTSIENRIHSYYVQAFKYNQEMTGVPREKFINAVKAELAPVKGRINEGIPIYEGYVKPIYLLPLFQKKEEFKNGFPFKGNENYNKGLCPVTEDMYYNKLFYHDFTRSPFSNKDVNDVIKAYKKVCDNINSLKA